MPDVAFNASQRNFLSALWSGSADSRSAVARRLRLSKPTASSLAAELLSAGMIEELGAGPSSGGKPPTLLRIRPDAFHCLGIDIGYEGRLYGIRLDAAGRIVLERSVPGGGEFAAMAEGIAGLVEALATPRTMGVGIAISGIVDPLAGQILQSSNFDLADRPLQRTLQERSGRPVLLDNRSRTAAFAEHLQGAARQEDDFVLLSLGKSIGSAFFLRGEPYIGRCRAGEISETRLSNGQTLEECMLPRNIRSQGLRRTAGLCAEGLFPLLSILDCPVLVLSGRFAELGPEFQRMLESELGGRFACDVRAARFGRLSAAFGAAAEAVEKFVFGRLYQPPIRSPKP